MAARPTVNVRGVDGAAAGSLPLPAVFTAPIRPDVVEAIHSTYQNSDAEFLLCGQILFALTSTTIETASHVFPAELNTDTFNS